MIFGNNYFLSLILIQLWIENIYSIKIKGKKTRDKFFHCIKKVKRLLKISFHGYIKVGIFFPPDKASILTEKKKSFFFSNRKMFLLFLEKMHKTHHSKYFFFLHHRIFFSLSQFKITVN